MHCCLLQEAIPGKREKERFINIDGTSSFSYCIIVYTDRELNAFHVIAQTIHFRVYMAKAAIYSSRQRARSFEVAPSASVSPYIAVYSAVFAV